MQGMIQMVQQGVMDGLAEINVYKERAEQAEHEQLKLMRQNDQKVIEL